MGLFKKKEIQPECQYIIAKCPNCGKEYTLPFYDFKWRLDGTPDLPMAKRMESFEVCECGMLVAHDAIATTRLTSKEHNDALQQKDITVRKLKVLHALTHDESLWLWCAHYYQECGDEEQMNVFLNKAIDAILNQQDRKVLRMPYTELSRIPLNTEYIMYPEDRLVDLYRQTKQWGKALQVIQKLRQQEYGAYPYARFAVLNLQENLIKAHNSSIQ